MLIGLEGGLGSGKTLIMVAFLLQDYLNGCNVFTNFHLINIKHKLIDIVKMLDYEQTKVSLKNASLGIDEITVFADCRSSAKRMNRLLSYFVLQSRKRDIKLYYTTQHFGMVDKRVIEHTEIKVLCDKIYNDYGHEIDGFRKYSFMDFRNRRDVRIKRYTMDIRPYYKYYDTNETILPPMGVI